jgi:VanZ family protein
MLPSQRLSKILPALNKKRAVMVAGRVRYWLPVLFWMVFIFYMSGQRGQDLPSLFPYQDIVFHFCVYMALGWQFGRALFFEKRRPDFFKIVCLCGLFGLLYGITDEFHQLFVSGRSCDLFDVNIDTLGSFIGGIIVRWLR